MEYTKDKFMMMGFFRKIFKESEKEQVYYLSGLEKGHQQITYCGVPCIKCPFDYVMYQMILNEVKPDLVIEIGTNYGGNAFYMADILNKIGSGIVHTIDIDNRSYPAVKEHPKIKLFNKGWESYDLNETIGYEKIMVIEDSSHQYKNTLGALKKFSPLVTLGSYFIVEDGIIDALGWTEKYDGGPVKAIKEFLQTHPEFQVAQNWINMFGKDATFNTLGYLKKIR